MLEDRGSGLWIATEFAQPIPGPLNSATSPTNYAIDKLLGETTDELLTTIWLLTALYWVYNADEGDSLEDEKLTQSNLVKCYDQPCLPGKFP